MDAGFLRPGRLDRLLFVGPLDRAGREEFLRSWLQVRLASTTSGLSTVSLARESSNGVGSELSLDREGSSTYSSFASTSSSISSSFSSGVASNPVIADCSPSSSASSLLPLHTSPSTEEFVTSIASRTDGFTGADMQLLIQRASLHLLVEIRRSRGSDTAGAGAGPETDAGAGPETDAGAKGGAGAGAKGVAGAGATNGTEDGTSNGSASVAGAPALVSSDISTSLTGDGSYTQPYPVRGDGCIRPVGALARMIPQLRHVDRALTETRPSVTAADLREYAEWRRSIRSGADSQRR